MKFGLDRWNPERWQLGRELSSLQREMDRFFDQFTSRLPQSLSTREVDFVPACDIDETDTQYLVNVDVPGFTKDQLKVSLKDNVLTVAGEYKEEKKEERKNRRITERARGYFERSFQLPNASDSAKVEASYADGVLHVAIQKASATKVKEIPIGEAKPAARAGDEKSKKPTEAAA